MHRRTFLLGAVGSIALTAEAACHRDGSPAESGSSSASTPIGPLFEPATLAARLAEVKSGKLAVWFVGPSILFRHHIPGARNLGEVSTPEGKAAIEAELKKTPAETEIVLYCGCCPVSHCPNVRPASALIRASGRPKTYVLNLPTRFATDWADPGFPVEQG